MFDKKDRAQRKLEKRYNQWLKGDHAVTAPVYMEMTIEEFGKWHVYGTIPERFIK